MKAVAGILARFGVKETRTEFVSDFCCAIYKVSYRDGKGSRSAALRIYPQWETDRSHVEAEIMWLQSLNRETDLLVPRPLVGVDGEAIQVIADPGTGSRRFAVLLTWMEGEHFDEFLSAEKFRGVGRLLGELHEHSQRFMLPGVVPYRQSAYLIDDDTWRTRGALSDEDARVLVSAEEDLMTQLADLDGDSELYGFLHADFHLWNLLFQGDNVAAIDYSDCGWGTYTYDIATALFYLKYPLVGNHDHRQNYERFEDAFLSGYTDVRPVPDNFEKALPVCFAARMLVIAQWVLCDTGSIDEMPWGPGCVAGTVEYLREYVDA